MKVKKTKMEQLATFKKANKEYKIKLAEKAGFKTAGEYLASLTGKSTKNTVKPVKSKENTALDMVIAFDTTGSMNSYIQSVKTHVVETIKELFKNSPKLQLKIVAFGDYCDMESSTKFGKAYQETQLTSNKKELIDFVNNAKSTGGGDADEFYELVIKKVVDETPWRKDAKKAFLLIGDCGPHPVGYSYSGIVKNAQICWKTQAKRALLAGIQIDTLQIHPEYDWYKELSKITNGVNLNFKNSNKISEIVTGTIYARSSPETFTMDFMAAEKSGDSELIGAYKSMSTLIDK